MLTEGAGLQDTTWVAKVTCQGVCQPCAVTDAVYIIHCQLADVKSVAVVLATTLEACQGRSVPQDVYLSLALLGMLQVQQLLLEGNHLNLLS